MDLFEEIAARCSPTQSIVDACLCEISTLREKLRIAEEALVTMQDPTRYDSRSSNIWKHYYASSQGDFVNLRDFAALRDETLDKIREEK